MLREGMTNQDLFSTLQELEIQNRELREMQEQLVQSRRRYADLYDFSPIGYVSLDSDSIIEEINIAGGKLLGETPHRLIGRPLVEFLASEDVEHFKVHLRRCRWSRKRRSIALRLTPQGAEPTDIQLFTLPTQDPDRRTLQFRTAMVDVTRRKRAETELRSTQKHLEQMVAERTEQLTSERRQREEAQRFLYEAGSVLAMSLDYEVTLSTVAQAGIPHLADAAVVDMVERDGSIKRSAIAHVDVDKEEQLRDTDRVPLPVDVVRTAQPELQEKVIVVPLIVRGNTIGAIRLMLKHPGRTYNSFALVLAEDLADRAAIALENATLYTKELEANRLKDDFLATVSHELRTPLTPILGAIYKLRAARKDDHDLQSALDLMERNAQTQARIVEDLLDVSRIATGKLDFAREPTDLVSIIESALAVARPSMKALGIELRTDIEPPPGPIWCDRNRIQQVVWNLLSNAIKFTRRGGSVEVRLTSTPGWAHIRIADTGIGIRPEFLSFIFEQFRQGSSFINRMHGGLGVGLAIVRYIVERHGGRVRAESRGEGHGSIFVVDLPYSTVGIPQHGESR
jgi:PAS domain S-box-containing protein